MPLAEQSLSHYEEAAPLDMLAALFEARGWPFEWSGEDELTGDIKAGWGTYELRAVWRREDRVLQIICLPDLRVPADKRGVLCDLTARINEQVWLGHFDLWTGSGMVLYRHALMLGDDALLGLGQAQNAVESAVGECDRFYPAFQFALWGDKSPQDALDAAMVDAVGEA